MNSVGLGEDLPGNLLVFRHQMAEILQLELRGILYEWRILPKIAVRFQVVSGVSAAHFGDVENAPLGFSILILDRMRGQTNQSSQLWKYFKHGGLWG